PVSAHKETGAYSIHFYADLSNGSAVYLGAKSVTVSAPTAAVQMGSVYADGSFYVTVSGIQSASGVSQVQIPTWTVAGGQDDIRWYTATKVDNATYVAKVSALNHNSEFGAYTAHVYLTAGNGVLAYVGGAAATQTAPAAVIASTCTNGQNVNLSAAGVIRTPGVTAVRFAVWGPAAVSGNVQNDLIWYDGVNQGGGRWVSTALVSNHKETGAYSVHAYATLANGSSVYLGASSFTVRAATADVSAVNVNAATGTFTIRLESIETQVVLATPRVAVWSANGGQDDLIWYMAVNKGSGVYEVAVDVTKHKSDFGVYYAHAYGLGANGIDFYLGGTAPTLAAPTVTVSGSVSTLGRNITVNVAQAFRTPGISKLQVAVWGEVGGQNDLVWYTMTSQGNGKYTYTVPYTNHKELGTYYLHVYATLTNGTSVFLGANSVTVR
ncbi:MAG: GBS Bsp-like repeat-containing protein, partial [Clostridiales Family XIII bacterium]|nr:GBS Bsp-like repeat-containing protein [Clostridiales Family XIII bacterium]